MNETLITTTRIEGATFSRDLGSWISSVFCRPVAHLTPENQRSMFPLFRKHSAPNAALLFTSGSVDGEAIGEYGGEPLYHGSLSSAEYTKLLVHNGFATVSHVAEDIACGRHTIWLAQLR
jgi:hypothetical protein